MKYPWQWDITDLENLIGQPESLRLEFKDARLLDQNQKQNSINRIVEELSKEVSAFANTEGGTLIIGIEEDKTTKPRVASQLSGVDISFWNPEKLQQIIESNISPPLPGIRVKPVYLNAEYSSCVYIIYIPAGTTAYQAKDHIYYGRSEYESKALPDHEIRMRMFRGKVPEAILVIQSASLEEAQVDPKNKELIEDEYLFAKTQNSIPAKRYTFDVSLKNIGETNIRAFKCKIEFLLSSSFGSHVLGKQIEDREFSFKDGWQKGGGYISVGFLDGPRSSEEPKMKINIYPEDIFPIGNFSFGLNQEIDLLEDDLLLKWTFYLEDRAPSQGEISIQENLFRSSP